jgi:hypothetical protein
MVYSGDLPRLACKDFEQDLVLYYYGELAGADHDKVEAHLESCAVCQHFLQDLHVILPLTAKPDEPPQSFWDSYSKEMHGKLREAGKKTSWWGSLSSLWILRPWPVPVFATAFVLVIALTLPFSPWGPEKPSPKQETTQEILPMAENLEFFQSMEFVESLDLLESLERSDSQEGLSERPVRNRSA